MLSLAHPATLSKITDFGADTESLAMHLYVPDRVLTPAPVLVAVHCCSGTGPAFYSSTQFATLADRFGFIVVFPSAVRPSQCFDVSSQAALTRGGGGDPDVVMAMVDYVRRHYQVDESRIYAAGASSGAMLTLALLALYPDVFAGGSAFAGVPFTGFATRDRSEWNTACADGAVKRSAARWGDAVRAAYPGYSGRLPKVQLWHGTRDEVLHFSNFFEAIKQWTNVHDVSRRPCVTEVDGLGHKRMQYGGVGSQAVVEAISMVDESHSLPVNAREVIRFFELDHCGASERDSRHRTEPWDTIACGATDRRVDWQAFPSHAANDQPRAVHITDWWIALAEAFKLLMRRTVAICGVRR